MEELDREAGAVITPHDRRRHSDGARRPSTSVARTNDTTCWPNVGRVSQKPYPHPHKDAQGEQAAGERVHTNLEG